MIDQYPPANGVLTSLIWRKTAAGGETSLSGYDNASQALSYTPGQEQVYLNGILLVRGSDYTATNGTSITGLAALAADDFIQINCYNNFSVASLPTSGLVGEISNSQITSLATSKLTGTVANNQLANSSITINGSAVSLGGSTTIAGGSAQDSEPTSPTEGQLWLDTNGTLATTAFTEKSTLTTTGDIYYASSANTPARLGIGSTGQVMTVSGGVPAWSALSSGGMTEIASTSFGGSTITFSSIPQTYKKLVIYVENTLSAYRLNGDSGNNYTSLITTTRISGQQAIITQYYTGQISAMLGNYYQGPTANSGTFQIIEIPNYASSNHRKIGYGTSAYLGTSAWIVETIWNALTNSNDAVTSITLTNSPAEGSATLYGVK